MLQFLPSLAERLVHRIRHIPKAKIPSRPQSVNSGDTCPPTSFIVMPRLPEYPTAPARVTYLLYATVSTRREASFRRDPVKFQLSVVNQTEYPITINNSHAYLCLARAFHCELLEIVDLSTGEREVPLRVCFRGEIVFLSREYLDTFVEIPPHGQHTTDMVFFKTDWKPGHEYSARLVQKGYRPWWAYGTVKKLMKQAKRERERKYRDGILCHTDSTVNCLAEIQPQEITNMGQTITFTIPDDKDFFG